MIGSNRRPTVSPGGFAKGRSRPNVSVQVEEIKEAASRFLEGRKRLQPGFMEPVYFGRKGNK